MILYAMFNKVLLKFIEQNLEAERKPMTCNHSPRQGKASRQNYYTKRRGLKLTPRYHAIKFLMQFPSILPKISIVDALEEFN